MQWSKEWNANVSNKQLNKEHADRRNLSVSNFLQSKWTPSAVIYLFIHLSSPARSLHTSDTRRRAALTTDWSRSVHSESQAAIQNKARTNQAKTNDVFINHFIYIVTKFSLKWTISSHSSRWHLLIGHRRNKSPKKQLTLQLTVVFKLIRQLFFWLINQLFGTENVKKCFVLKCLVLSTTQRFSVYCQRGGKKTEHIHIQQEFPLKKNQQLTTDRLIVRGLNTNVFSLQLNKPITSYLLHFLTNYLINICFRVLEKRWVSSPKPKTCHSVLPDYIQ